MSNEIKESREDWESERVFGHYLPLSREERRCQVTAKIQCVLQEYMPKDNALVVAKEIVSELGL